MRHSALTLLLALVAPAAGLAAGTGDPMAFAPAAIAEWPQRAFEGATSYRLVTTAERPAVEATAEDAASALYREVEIDIKATPILEWRWRIDALPGSDADERTRAGDDYAARVYVVREGLFGQLSARALNYVWSREVATGTRWANAFTDRAHMIAVASGPERAGEWVTHRRDLRADWRAAFGDSLERIHGIAIMTDSDNTDGTARAHYGTIRFRADDGD